MSDILRFSARILCFNISASCIACMTIWARFSMFSISRCNSESIGDTNSLAMFVGINTFAFRNRLVISSASFSIVVTASLYFSSEPLRISSCRAILASRSASVWYARRFVGTVLTLNVCILDEADEGFVADLARRGDLARPVDLLR